MLLFGNTEVIFRDSYSKKRPWLYIKRLADSLSHVLNYNKMHKVCTYHFLWFLSVTGFSDQQLTTGPKALDKDDF